MSNQQEIADILGDTESLEESSIASKAIQLALQEVSKVLSATNDSLNAVCTRVEEATTREKLRKAFRQFNGIMQMFTEAVPREADDHMVSEALRSLSPSDRFMNLLISQASVATAVSAYKTLIIRDLAAVLRRKEELLRSSEEQDDLLFNRWLPTAPVDQDIPEAKVDISPVSVGALSSSRKRGIGAVLPDPVPLRIPKKVKSKIPALASLSEVIGQSKEGNTTKRALMTREKLRAGLYDPKGLLDLMDSSTSALERTKKLELLKSAGVEFNSQKGSFSERLNAATLRLDLGLAGHRLSDTLLFGAKVLSTPGFLKPKNIADVENNRVDSTTTWTHQNTYSKMMIAGCLNQAKRILSKYDDVLFGPVPEAQIEHTHKAIRSFLCSDEVQPFVSKEFLKKLGSTEEEDISDCDNFIKKVIAMVPPIIPLSLRNKTLDGGYLRTVLHLLGAGEILFRQYEADIRGQANPAGLVGMCSTMHSEFERCTLFNEELRTSRVFCSELKAQYQTSLGLGESFSNDSVARKKSRRGFPFARGSSSHRRFGGRGSGRGQQGFPSGSGFQGMGRGQSSPVPVRGRGVCFNFLAGSCGRGNTCRYLHQGQ